MPPASTETPATPRAASRTRARRTRREKEAVLEMFDLGLADQLARIDQAHEAKMALFTARQQAEISRIPLAVRKMTVRELGLLWRDEDGLRGVMQRLAEVKIGKEQKVGGDVEEEMREGAAKRKRIVSASSNERSSETSSRPTKNARTAPAGLKTPKSVRKKKPVASASTSTAANVGPSSVPTLETFQFHPLLPSTPLLKSTASGYRKPRRNESIVMSLNGSPLVLDELLKRMAKEVVGDRAGESEGEDGADGEEGEQDNEDEAEVGLGLLDEETLMRQMEGAKTKA